MQMSSNEIRNLPGKHLSNSSIVLTLLSQPVCQNLHKQMIPEFKAGMTDFI